MIKDPLADGAIVYTRGMASVCCGEYKMTEEERSGLELATTLKLRVD
jgi:hypothetical protein